MKDLELSEFFKSVYVEKGVKEYDVIKKSWDVVRAKYSDQQIKIGLSWIMDNVEKYPNSFHFNQALKKPSEDISQKDLANKGIQSLKEALKKFGYTSPGKAKEYLGEELWAAIGYSGGYQSICRNFDTSNTSYIAQLRDNIGANLFNPGEFVDSLPESKKVTSLLEETIKKIGEKL